MATQSYANRRLLLDHHIRTVEPGDWLFFRGHHRVVQEVKRTRQGAKVVTFKDGLGISVNEEQFDDCWIPEIHRPLNKFRAFHEASGMKPSNPIPEEPVQR